MLMGQVSADIGRDCLYELLQLRKRVCTGPTQVENYLVELGERWGQFEAFGARKSDGVKIAALVEWIRDSLSGIFQILVSKPELDYTGLCRVLISATSYMKEDVQKTEPVLGMRATTTCAECGKPGHSAHECWVAHPEKKPAVGKMKTRCFKYNRVGHLKRECPELVGKDTVNNKSYKPKHENHPQQPKVQTSKPNCRLRMHNAPDQR